MSEFLLQMFSQIFQNILTCLEFYMHALLKEPTYFFYHRTEKNTFATNSYPLINTSLPCVLEIVQLLCVCARA